MIEEEPERRKRGNFETFFGPIVNIFLDALVITMKEHILERENIHISEENRNQILKKSIWNLKQ